MICYDPNLPKRTVVGTFTNVVKHKKLFLHLKQLKLAPGHPQTEAANDPRLSWQKMRRAAVDL